MGDVSDTLAKAIRDASAGYDSPGPCMHLQYARHIAQRLRGRLRDDIVLSFIDSLTDEFAFDLDMSGTAEELGSHLRAALRRSAGATHA